MVDDNVEVSPALKFPLPVRYGGKWGDDKVGTPDAILKAGINECQRLDSFPQTHLISQNTVTPGWEERKESFNNHNC